MLPLSLVWGWRRDSRGKLAGATCGAQSLARAGRYGTVQCQCQCQYQWVAGGRSAGRQVTCRQARTQEVEAALLAL
eukprot:421369-Prorocentrum_lima.AAC.1